MKAKEAVASLLHEIDQKQAKAKGLNRLKSRLEYGRYDTPEYIDMPDFPIEKKVKIIQGLDLKNKLFGTYQSIIEYLEPLISEVNIKEKRPFKILELAGGLGDLSIGLYKECVKSKRNLDVSIYGSDIVPEYIKIAQQKARKEGAEVEFKVIDALKVSPGEYHAYDLVVILHSIHHFNAESLYLLIQKSQIIAKYGLFAVDGKRNLGNLLFMVGTAILPAIGQLNAMYVHDAFISGVNMYSQSFLRSLANLAAPDSEVVCGSLSLGLTYLRVSPTLKP